MKPPLQNPIPVLAILWRISASRWLNRLHYWRSLYTGKGIGKNGWAGIVFTGFLVALLLATGFFLANTALIAPADEAALVTDDQEKDLVELATFKGFQEADRQLERVRLFPAGPIRKAVEDRWYKYAGEVANLEARQHIMTDQEQIDYAAGLVNQFKTKGVAGFAYWHSGFTGLSEPLWPRSGTGQVLYAQVIGFIFCLIPLILLLLHLGVTSRELAQVEWSFEWLFSFPIPARTLFLGRILSWTANPTVWCFVLPYAWLVFVAAGLRWWSPWAGIMATIYLALIAGSLAILAEVLLRKFLTLSQLKNVQALCTAAGGCLLLLYVTLSASRLVASDLTLFLGHVPIALFGLPAALPVAVVLPGNSTEGELAAAFGMTVIAVGLPWLCSMGCESLTRDGLIKTASSQKSLPLFRRTRTNRPLISDRSWWMILPGSDVWSVELVLLTRDRNLLTQVLLCPLLVIAYYLLSQVSVLAAATNEFKHAAALSYGISAYILLNSAFPLLSREQKTLWLIGGLPRDLVDILLAKIVAWVVFSCCYAGCFMIGLASLQSQLHFSMLGDALVTLLGVALCGFLAGGIGVLATDVSGQEVKMRPDLVYFYLLLATFFIGAIYYDDLLMTFVQILLTAGVAWAIWQRVEHVLPFASDPLARPAGKIELIDALVPILVYFVARQAFLALLLHAFLLPVEAPATQMWASWGAGVLAVASSLATLISNRIAHLPDDLYLKFGKPLTLEDWWGLATILVALIMIIRFYYEAIPSPLQFYPNYPANGSIVPTAPAWLRCNGTLCLLPWLLIGSPLISGYLFRSLLLGQLLRKFQPTPAIIISAAITMMVQSFGLSTAFPTFCIGFATGYVFWMTRSSYPPILLHTAFNGIVILLTG